VGKAGIDRGGSQHQPAVAVCPLHGFAATHPVENRGQCGGTFVISALKHSGIMASTRQHSLTRRTCASAPRTFAATEARRTHGYRQRAKTSKGGTLFKKGDYDVIFEYFL
jgi:hypothetical protein